MYCQTSVLNFIQYGGLSLPVCIFLVLLTSTNLKSENVGRKIMIYHLVI